MSKYYSAETLKMCFIQNSVTVFSNEDSDDDGHSEDTELKSERSDTEEVDSNEVSQVQSRRPKFFPSVKKSSGYKISMNSLIFIFLLLIVTNL